MFRYSTNIVRIASCDWFKDLINFKNITYWYDFSAVKN